MLSPSVLNEVMLLLLILLLQVLAESDQLRKEADDLGPRAELDHWKKRMSRFNYLLDQLKSPDVKAVLGVLLMAKSKLIKVRNYCQLLQGFLINMRFKCNGLLNGECTVTYNTATV